VRDAWLLDPEIRFLNHGSFGACPRVVLDLQSELRARLEREPVYFYLRQLERLLDEAREQVARFVGARPDDLGFVRNATTGVNAVLRSLRLEPGDELLVTNHGYNACTNVARHVAERAGARVVTASFPFPLASEDEVVAAVLGAATDRTRLVLLDHVTSPTPPACSTSTSARSGPPGTPPIFTSTPARPRAPRCCGPARTSRRTCTPP
jgi:isopenicillin-N epimerase